MASPPSIVSSSPARTESATGSLSVAERLAYAVTYAVNPLVMPVIALGMVAAWSPAPTGEVLLITATAAVFFAVIPAAYLFHLSRSGRISSVEIRSRKQRIRPLFMGALLLVPGVVAVGAVASTTQMLMLGLAATFVINALLVGIITVWWKISIHASAVAGVVALVVGMIPFPFIHVDASTLALAMSGSIAALAAVMWSRVRLDAHSRAEVAVGAIFGMLITWVELYFITSLLP